MTYSEHNRGPRRIPKHSKRADIEHQLQVGEVAWAELQGGVWPELLTLHAIPNQGKRGKLGNIRMVAEGLKPGMPDLHLPVARRGWSSLYVENKKIDEDPRPEQLEIMRLLTVFNNLCYVIRHHVDFVTLLTWYLGHEDHTSDVFSQDADFGFVLGTELAY